MYGPLPLFKQLINSFLRKWTKKKLLTGGLTCSSELRGSSIEVLSKKEQEEVGSLSEQGPGSKVGVVKPKEKIEKKTILKSKLINCS